MKKILMTLSFALAAAIAVPSTMNAQDTKVADKTVCNDTCSNISKDCKNINTENCNCEPGQRIKADRKGKKGDFKGHGKKGKSEHRKDGKMAGNRQNPLFKGITLTEEQQQQFKALREKRAAEHKASRAELKKEKAQKKLADAEQMKKRAEAYDKEIEKILTPEQYKQYESNKEVMDKLKRERRK